MTHEAVSAPRPVADAPSADPHAGPGPSDGAPHPRLPYPVRVVLIVAAMILNLFVSPLILGLPLSLLPQDSMPMPVLQVLSLLVRAMPTVGAVVLVWVLMRFVDRRPVREAGLVFSPSSLPLALAGVALSLLAVLPAGIAVTQAGLTRPELEYTQGTSPFWTLLLALTLGLFAQGFPEEYLWRGYGLQTMRHRPVLAWLTSGVVFGLMHYISAAGQQGVGERFAYLLPAMMFGLLAGALTIVSGSLWPAVGVHFGVHLAFYFASLMDLGTGPWLWLSEAAGFAVLTLAVFVIFRRRFVPQIRLQR